MSDTGDVGGAQNFNFSVFGRRQQPSFPSEIKIPGIENATSQLRTLTDELKTLTQTLGNLSTQQATLASGLTNMMKVIQQQAGQSAQALQQFAAAAGQAGTAATTGGGGGSGGGGGRIASYMQNTVMPSASSLFQTVAMFPLKYMTGQLDLTRQMAMNTSSALGGQMYATGATQQQMMRVLSSFPGGVQGSPEDLLNLMQAARAYGAMPDLSGIGAQAPGGRGGWGAQGPTTNPGQQNPRAVGFLRGVAQMQAMTPGAPVSQLAGTLGSYAATTQAAQQSIMMTGGAFAMIGAGGRQRSISEWAEGILSWLEGQRPPPDTGKGFTYGEMQAQYFPGSNIDVWLTVNGVPDGMKEYFWNYALAKARTKGRTTPLGTRPGAPRQEMEIAPAQTARGQGNLAWERLGAASAQTRGQLRLGGELSGMFSNREQANRWFNEIIAQATAQVIPAQISGGSLGALQYMPDQIQEMMMALLERMGVVGAGIGGYLGYGIEGGAGLVSSIGGLLTGGLDTSTGAIDSTGLQAWLKTMFSELGFGDIGDSDHARLHYGEHGGTTTAGMHPSMASRLGDMMSANPRLSITSGLRDTNMQRNLRNKGHSRVSGKPSAHTRGLAADLGPRSEYPWIVANARRFGLKSGANKGEPWHVGLGDVDIGQPPDDQVPDIPPDFTTNPTQATDLSGGGQSGLASLLEILQAGVTRPQAIAGIGKLVPWLMTLMFGGLGVGTEIDRARLAFDPSIYQDLRDQYKHGITVGGLMPTAPPLAGGGSITDYLELLNTAGRLNLENILSGAGLPGLPGATPTTGPLPPAGEARSLESGIAAATALFNAGFKTRAELETITAISWRESGWQADPQPPNPNGEDTGLMQINVVAHAGRLREFGYSQQDLLDAQKNANIAYDIYKDSGNFMAWNYSDKSMQWGAPPRPGWAPANNPYPSSPLMGTEGSNAKAVVAAANISGLVGDIDSDYSPYIPPNQWEGKESKAEGLIRAGLGDYYAATAPLGQQHPQQVVFNNTFTVQGGATTGGGGVDVRRTVTLIADQLEDEMKKRMSRRN